MRSGVSITTSSLAAGAGGARHRRPGSRRSTSAWTVYVGAHLAPPALAADLPWARRAQAVAVAPFPGGRLQTASRLPGRRYFSSERTDLRSPWAARFDEQRGRPQAFRDLSRFRGLGLSRLLTFFAARSRSTSAADFRTPSAATTPSRAAVTGATSRAGAQATLSAAHGLTARAAHNRIGSAGQGAALPSDLPALFAVSTSHLGNAPRKTDHASSRGQGLPTDNLRPITATTLAPSLHAIPNLSAVSAAPAAARMARVGLIEQSTRPDGDGFPAWPQSTRPAWPIPAGVTQGEGEFSAPSFDPGAPA